MKKKSLKDYLLVTLKGLAMGAVDVVPGVSGGTIAFISGIYEELLDSIKSVVPAFKNLVTQGFDIKRFWKEINGNFLLALLTGIAVSLISFARLIRYLLAEHPILIWSFFFGLIVASAWYVLRDIKNRNAGIIALCIAGIVAGYSVTVISPAETPETYWFVFLSGAVAICAMILPAISGAFILLLMGKYEFILNALTTADIPVLSVFVCGAIVGIIGFSNFFSWLLKNYNDLTVAFLGGVMIGSLNKIWPWKATIEIAAYDSEGKLISLVEKNILPSTYGEIHGEPSLLIAAVSIAVIGFSVVFAIDKIARNLKNKRQPR